MAHHLIRDWSAYKGLQIYSLYHMHPYAQTEHIPDWNTNELQNTSRNIYDHIHFSNFVCWKRKHTKYV